MRFNFRVKNFGYTIFLMVSETQTLHGVTSLLANGNHYPFFDVDNCSLDLAETELGKIQVSYGLSNIYITSDKERSFRGWCYSQVKFTEYLRMQLDLIDSGLLDYNFFWWTVRQGKSTLRCNRKKNRPYQELASTLHSYYVPIPKTGLVTQAIYDTGIQKRGFTIFLGEKGKIIFGDKRSG